MVAQQESGRERRGRYTPSSTGDDMDLEDRIVAPATVGSDQQRAPCGISSQTAGAK